METRLPFKNQAKLIVLIFLELDEQFRFYWDSNRAHRFDNGPREA